MLKGEAQVSYKANDEMLSTSGSTRNCGKRRINTAKKSPGKALRKKEWKGGKT